MTPTAATAARALTSAWESIVGRLDRGWHERVPGAVGVATMAPDVSFNGVWADELEVDVDRIVTLLDRLARPRVPHSLHFRAGAEPTLGELAGARGMQRVGDQPLMVLDDPAALESVAVAGLALEQLEPEQAALHAQLAAAGFGAPEEIFAQLVKPEVLSAPGVRCYVGRIDGEAVATGLGRTDDEAVGVFNIATLDSHRRRGYAAAITARVVLDGLQNGGSWAYLQSSPAGYGVYERLGFRTVEQWQCWCAT